MKKNELAQLLGISGSMVTRLEKRGMPVDSLERAQRWRKRHLEPGRMKGTRFDPDQVRSKPVALQPAEAVIRAIALLNIATVAHEEGQSIAPLVPTLRAALRAVPAHQRGNVLLPPEVMNILVADVYAACAGQLAQSPADETAPLSDTEAANMGIFWYQVAAGEWSAA